MSSSIKKYAYHMKGNEIALLEYKDSTSRYESPSADVISGLKIEYVNMPTMPTTEEDEIPFDEHVCYALVYYLKAKLAEDADEFEKREYFMRLFTREIGKYNGSREYGIKRIGTIGPFAIR